ncbi:MAG: PEP-CTERM sorting domain-containing protein, partial [Burkholderiales bacterium]|nr:PEP-CTERM sorting domain-containing protein [Burkholderiales bacterium]
GVDVGTFYDYVYRSDSDGTLLFASRFVLEVEEVGDYTVEINDIFRRGFDGYDVAVGWYDPDSGSRLVSAALSDIGRTRPQLPDVFNPDQVDLRTDVSIEEDNPSTAWYVIKTNATEFAYLADAVGVYQAASTDGMDPPLRLANFEGLAPVAAIPEPGEYAMMLVGLVAIGVMVKRRNKRVAA